MAASPGIYCVPIGYRNSLIDLVKGVSDTNISPNTLNQIATICQRNQQNKLSLDDRSLSHSNVLDIDDADANHEQTLSKTHVINNYILLPVKTKIHRTNNVQDEDCSEHTVEHPNTCTRVKKNVDTLDNNKDTNLEEQAKSEGNNVILKKNQEKTSSLNDIVNVSSETKLNLKQTDSSSKQKKSKKKQNYLKERNVKVNELLQNEKQSSQSGGNKISLKNVNLSANNSNTTQNNKLKTKKSIKINSNNHVSSKKNIRIPKNNNNNRSKENQSKIKSSDSMNSTKRKNNEKLGAQQANAKINNKSKVGNVNDPKNIYNNVPVSSRNVFPYTLHDSHNMNKYIETIFSNYRLPSLSNDFPFYFNNLYQQSPWNNFKTRRNKTRPHRNRKKSNLNKRKSKRKNLNSKNEKPERTIISPAFEEVITKDNNHDTLPSVTSNILINSPLDEIENISGKTKLLENISERRNESILKEPENTVLESFDTLTNYKNITLAEESLKYNSLPSFIIGSEDAVPIIFEDGFVDDYYPNFIADNQGIKETHLRKHHGDKFHYVSNQYSDFEDYLKARKRFAMKNLNKHSNLLFSGSEVNRELVNSIAIKEDEKVQEPTKESPSPLLLDNPDFRTRKIDSNEKYEPYYHHDIFSESSEDVNKNYLEDKAVVYPSSALSKCNMKNELCNSIDYDSKSKWKKSKDADVETVHSRSKLAKYGLHL
ncbi:asparagine-rich protein-like [Battus philenor]|uniref:asparagine-rich protein-like n=1 Tax=Battus philenor TaxID=42288 RepID=UPI0035CFDF1C